MIPLPIWLYLAGSLCCMAGAAMFGLSFGWKARLYRTQWDYRFTAVVFAVLAAVAVGTGWYASRR